MPHTLTIFFFFNTTATTEIYTLSLHDALPILVQAVMLAVDEKEQVMTPTRMSLAYEYQTGVHTAEENPFASLRSEEHTSELQSRPHLVCRLLLEKKNTSASCALA